MLLKKHKQSGNSESPLSVAQPSHQSCQISFFPPAQSNKLSCFSETIHFHHIRNLLILDENSSINQFLIEFSPEGKRRNWARFAFWLLWVLSLTEHTWQQWYNQSALLLLHIKCIFTANVELWRQSLCYRKKLSDEKKVAEPLQCLYLCRTSAAAQQELERMAWGLLWWRSGVHTAAKAKKKKRIYTYKCMYICVYICIYKHVKNIYTNECTYICMSIYLPFTLCVTAVPWDSSSR